MLARVMVMLLGGAHAALPADRGGRVEYIGGTVAYLRNGEAGILDTTDRGALLFIGGKLTVHIPYRRVNLIEYGQKVGRRVAMAIIISPLIMLAKSRKHFLTVGYEDESGQQQALVFRVEKDDVRSLLVGLEARTGLKVQYQDEEARKGGKG